VDWYLDFTGDVEADARAFAGNWRAFLRPDRWERALRNEYPQHRASARDFGVLRIARAGATGDEAEDGAVLENLLTRECRGACFNGYCLSVTFVLSGARDFAVQCLRSQANESTPEFRAVHRVARALAEGARRRRPMIDVLQDFYDEPLLERLERLERLNRRAGGRRTARGNIDRST